MPSKTDRSPEPGVAFSAGESFLAVVTTVGGMTVLLGKTLSRIGRLALDRDELMRNLHKMGVRSIPIVLVTALFTGAIMVVQSAPMVERWGAHGLLGWASGFGILREIGPLLTALMINGRVGANNTAELGTMVVTEQVDALRVLAIDPIAFLVGPRFVAMVITLLASTVMSDALALVGAAASGMVLLGVSPRLFYHGVTSGFLSMEDVTSGLVKSVVFGIVMALASCHYGLAVKGGAPGVGRAVNDTVVASAAGIFVLDYFVSFLLG